MDKLKLSALIGAQPDGTFTVNSIQVDSWGRTLRLDCAYALGSSEPEVRFTMMLDDCRELQWRVYAHLKHPEDQTLPMATLVNVRLGAQGHHKPLHLLTDFFGLTVNYGTLTVMVQPG